MPRLLTMHMGIDTIVSTMRSGHRDGPGFSDFLIHHAYAPFIQAASSWSSVHRYEVHTAYGRTGGAAVDLARGAGGRLADLDVRMVHVMRTSTAIDRDRESCSVDSDVRIRSAAHWHADADAACVEPNPQMLVAVTVTAPNSEVVALQPRFAKQPPQP